MRVLGLLVLLLILGGLVASGVEQGWTAMHFKMGVPLVLLAVVVAMPTRKPAGLAAGRPDP